VGGRGRGGESEDEKKSQDEVMVVMIVCTYPPFESKVAVKRQQLCTQKARDQFR
jgi:hypothetical protein